MDNIRTRRILAYLKVRKSCSAKELMEHFKASSATIHRDIVALSAAGSVERVRGGIVYRPEGRAQASSSSYEERQVANRDAKVSIAKKALSLIEEDDILFLDSSTTIYELALLLPEAGFQHLTIITNAVPVMRLFAKMPTTWAMIGLGGNFDPQLNSMLGASTLDELARLNISKAFVSAFGLDAKVATTNHERQAELLAKVIETADRSYLAIDGAKTGRRGLYRFAARDEFAAIVGE